MLQNGLKKVNLKITVKNRLGYIMLLKNCNKVSNICLYLKKRHQKNISIAMCLINAFIHVLKISNEKKREPVLKHIHEIHY